MLVELEDRCIEIERPEKWVWYDNGYTIMDLVRYYVAVSPWLLPYLKDRPIVYETYPGTINGPNTFEQDPPPNTPRWVKRTKVRGHERVVTYVVADSAATLAYLVSLFMVTVHVWQSTTEKIECPDFLLVDLDPSETCTLAELARAALQVRDFLAEFGVGDALVKSSGARGLHVMVFVEPQYDYKIVRALSQSLARELARRHADRFTIERDPRKRPARSVYIDWGQVGRGMSIVPPFSPRACEGAPVSMPLQWSEIEELARSRSKRAPIEYFKRYNIASVLDALKERGDPWENRRICSLTPLFKMTERVRSTYGENVSSRR
jgi:bifunctional non-homologous end joining protein LigD